ncbi:putative lipopolysaccharide heptosyltransferase III [Parachitinimonas caeni]|uniref:Lipopolysaccharide heptosyltransferase III n=1 Tax=Parachitinimonas caeni TaxID=3031301 RepID=A0ABT7E297_9NEIS|nr:putative lipopolysaccharide heptosyltransferase III [Parachitinimonas caeni]MDK2126431.1 putative lipopolysaccharide heptosyltransferase III [Parachitinimonas caeni]
MSRRLPPFDPASLRRALVIKLRHHGDVLLTSPVLSSLKAVAPEAEIDSLVYADTAPMLDGHPALAQLHQIDRHWKRLGPRRQLAAEWQLLQTLKRREYDLVLHLTEHNRGAWLSRWLQPRWSVAPAIGRSRFFNRSFGKLYPFMTGNRRHTVELNLDALRALGIDPAHKALTLCPSDTARAKINTLLAMHGLAGQRFVLCHPGSRWLFKAWPPAHTAAVLNGLMADGWPVVISGAPDAAERAVVDAVRAQLTHPTVDLVGQLSLTELGALIGRASLLLGVDSAPMHMAAALDVPQVVLFGPSGEHDWGPWSDQATVLVGNHPCRPCGLAGCADSGRADCLRALAPAPVLQACRERLAGRVPRRHILVETFKPESSSCAE